MSAGRRARLASLESGVTALAPQTEPEVGVAVDVDAPAPERQAGTSAAKPAPAKPAPKPDLAKPAPEPTDEQTTKGLSAIDRRAKQFREEQAALRAEQDRRQADLERRQADLDARGNSVDELRKLAKIDPAAALAKLGLESEDDWELAGKAAYPRTRAGKADPKLAAAAASGAAQTAREREMAAELADLKRSHSELADKIAGRDAAAAQQSYLQSYIDSAVKAIPADSATLIGKLHAKAPEKARQAILETGRRMERAAAEEAGALRADGTYKHDPLFTPSHDAVIAEYERARRAELEEQDVDVAALLAAAPAKPVKPAPGAAPARTTTLDPTKGPGLTPKNPNPTREEKLTGVTRGLQQRWSGN